MQPSNKYKHKYHVLNLTATCNENGLLYVCCMTMETQVWQLPYLASNKWEVLQPSRAFYSYELSSDFLLHSPNKLI